MTKMQYVRTSTLLSSESLGLPDNLVLRLYPDLDGILSEKYSDFQKNGTFHLFLGFD